MREAIALITVLIALLVVSNEDYKDSLRDQETYCQNLKDGVWPDYRGIEKDCRKLEKDKIISKRVL